MAHGEATIPNPLGAASAGAAPERDDALVRAVINAMEVTGAHAGSVFLISRDRRSLVLTGACGTPPSLLGGWRRIPVNSSVPVAEAYRTGRMVHLTGAEETMRRFPQLAVAVPYAFGSASVPVSGRADLRSHGRAVDTQAGRGGAVECAAPAGCARRPTVWAPCLPG